MLGVSGCGRSESKPGAGERGRPAAGTAVILGTCLDATTGEALGGVEVTGPLGVSAVSDEEGRFVLAGIPEGTGGQLMAHSPEGWRAVNRLRPLRNARLEVVLHLRPTQDP